MSDSLDDLSKRLKRLEDIEAIKALKARYLRACDQQKPDDVRDTLLPEGVVIAYEGFPEFTDRDAFVAVFAEMGCQPGIYDSHHAANADIDIINGTQATGKWALSFRNINMNLRMVTEMDVEYEDVYSYQDGRWWIAETRTKRKSIVTYTVTEAGETHVQDVGKPEGMFGD